MNRYDLKVLIRECLKEVGEDLSNNTSIHVPGYAVVSVNRSKQRILEDLTKAIEAVKKDDWKTVNYILGRKGNGVIPAMITAIKDFTEGKGIVTYGDDQQIKNIS